MELWLTFVALYAWQCLAWLHVPSAVFGPRWLGAGDLRRRGVQLLSPWPSTPGIVAARPPFALVDEGCRVALDAGDGLGAAEPIALEGLSLERRSRRLVSNGRVLLRGASAAQARDWQRMLATLAALPAGERAGSLEHATAASLDVAALRERLEHAQRATRWLARLCDLDLLFMLLGVPAIGLVLGSEYALAISLPSLAALHLAGVLLAFFAHRRLFPAARGERFEALFMALLYPPALLRCAQAWVDAACTGHHPLAWARVLAAEDDARRVWLRERARLEREATRQPDRRDALRAEIDAIDAAMPADWATPRARRREDPTAESYCPVCWDDFRGGFDRCRGCDAETIRYAPVTS